MCSKFATTSAASANHSTRRHDSGVEAGDSTDARFAKNFENRRYHEIINAMIKPSKFLGNSTVSSYANACLVSLAIARGEPEMLFSTVQCLLCDEKQNLPFNQLTSESNPLPKNFQSMAFTVQRLVQNGITNLELTSFCNTSILDHSEFATFELEYSGSFSSTEFLEDSGASKSCLVSDGSYIYILNSYGLFKVGTGLTETQAAKVMSVNEMLKFIDGSSLLICHESLYLRRKHSTRLWVIDKETLREIGEIMLHASLTEGILFADGKCFYQGTLDEQWNFMVSSDHQALISTPNLKLILSTQAFAFAGYPPR